MRKLAEKKIRARRENSGLYLKLLDIFVECLVDDLQAIERDPEDDAEKISNARFDAKQVIKESQEKEAQLIEECSRLKIELQSSINTIKELEVQTSRLVLDIDPEYPELEKHICSNTARIRKEKENFRHLKIKLHAAVAERQKIKEYFEHEENSSISSMHQQQELDRRIKEAVAQEREKHLEVQIELNAKIESIERYGIRCVTSDHSERYKRQNQLETVPYRNRSDEVPGQSRHSFEDLEK